MTSPTPDTSPKNVARVLRHSAGLLDDEGHKAFVLRSYVLADALDAISAVSWGTRVTAALNAGNGTACTYHVERDMVADPRCADCQQTRMDAAIRAAFPEMAP